MGFSFLLAAILAVGIFFYLSKKQDNDIKDKQITEEAFKYEKHGIGSILIVKKKSSVAASNLTVFAHREIFTKEIPDRIVYTGATVGGITTGGFHIQKGGIAYSEGDKTGQYSLCYRYAGMVNNEPWSEVVSFLQLSDELMKEAKESPILKKRIVTEEDQKQLNSLYGFSGKRNLISLLDLNEGTARGIKAWLGGNNAINTTTSADNTANTFTNRKTPPVNSYNVMKEVFETAQYETVVFGDNGMTVAHTEIGIKHRRYCPYEWMTTFKATVRIGVIIEIAGTDSNGNQYQMKLGFNTTKDEKDRLKNVIAFAQKRRAK